MANKCNNSACSCKVMDGVEYCSKHKNPPKRVGAKGSIKGNPIFGPGGRVGIGQGLKRVAQQDWENAKRERASLILALQKEIGIIEKKISEMIVSVQ